ncbi:MAG: SUMF1/EgtB/PvdO family nonheme iron enzyme [Gemmataceae bacterium]
MLLAVLCLLACADDKELTNSLGMKLRRVGAGAFTMGTPGGPPKNRADWLKRDEDESPAHAVKISRPFLLGVHEVTNAQYERFDPGHKKLRGTAGASKDDDGPVTLVTWQQAADFCEWLSKQEGKPYRLPTEAEWEYACRAGTTTDFSTGERLTAGQANLAPAKAGAVPVGRYPANPWGFHDMHGNVAEWCSDWCGPYDAATQTDPVGRADGHARAVRGWSHLATHGQQAARFARCANRSGHLPDDANAYTGFRVVQGEAPATKPLPVAAPPLNMRGLKQTPARAERPDPKKPHVVSYPAGGTGPSLPAESWGPLFSHHNHYTASCVCPNGDVLAVWYTCVGESDRQLAQAASRLRAGSDRWEPASLFFAVPDVNCHAPVLLRDGGRIYHFFIQALDRWDNASNVVRHSDDSGATWSKPRVILPRERPDSLSQPCSAFVAKDGALVVACDGQVHKDEKLIVSRDKGKTWKVAKGDMRAAAGGRYVIHPAAFQREDGAILAYLRGPHPMPVAVSKDGGDSWEVSDAPFPGIGTAQKSAVLRLASGAVVMLTAQATRAKGGGTMVALSPDGGATWPHVRKLECPLEGYLSVAQGADGVIHLIGSRRNMAACNEAWLRDGGPLRPAK